MLIKKVFSLFLALIFICSSICSNVLAANVVTNLASDESSQIESPTIIGLGDYQKEASDLSKLQHAYQYIFARTQATKADFLLYPESFSFFEDDIETSFDEGAVFKIKNEEMPTNDEDSFDYLKSTTTANLGRAKALYDGNIAILDIDKEINGVNKHLTFEAAAYCNILHTYLAKHERCFYGYDDYVEYLSDEDYPDKETNSIIFVNTEDIKSGKLLQNEEAFFGLLILPDLTFGLEEVSLAEIGIDGANEIRNYADQGGTIFASGKSSWLLEKLGLLTNGTVDEDIIVKNNANLAQLEFNENTDFESRLFQMGLVSRENDVSHSYFLSSFFVNPDIDPNLTEIAHFNTSSSSDFYFQDGTTLERVSRPATSMTAAAWKKYGHGKVIFTTAHPASSNSEFFPMVLNAVFSAFSKDIIANLSVVQKVNPDLADHIVPALESNVHLLTSFEIQNFFDKEINNVHLEINVAQGFEASGLELAPACDYGLVEKPALYSQRIECNIDQLAAFEKMLVEFPMTIVDPMVTQKGWNILAASGDVEYQRHDGRHEIVNAGNRYLTAYRGAEIRAQYNPDPSSFYPLKGEGVYIDNVLTAENKEHTNAEEVEHIAVVPLVSPVVDGNDQGSLSYTLEFNNDYYQDRKSSNSFVFPFKNYNEGSRDHDFLDYKSLKCTDSVLAADWDTPVKTALLNRSDSGLPVASECESTIEGIVGKDYAYSINNEDLVSKQMFYADSDNYYEHATQRQLAYLDTTKENGAQSYYGGNIPNEMNNGNVAKKQLIFARNDIYFYDNANYPLPEGVSDPDVFFSIDRFNPATCGNEKGIVNEGYFDDELPGGIQANEYDNQLECKHNKQRINIEDISNHTNSEVRLSHYLFPVADKDNISEASDLAHFDENTGEYEDYPEVKLIKAHTIDFTVEQSSTPKGGRFTFTLPDFVDFSQDPISNDLISFSADHIAINEISYDAENKQIFVYFLRGKMPDETHGKPDVLRLNLEELNTSDDITVSVSLESLDYDLGNVENITIYNTIDFENSLTLTKKVFLRLPSLIMKFRLHRKENASYFQKYEYFEPFVRYGVYIQELAAHRTVYGFAEIHPVSDPGLTLRSGGFSTFSNIGSSSIPFREYLQTGTRQVIPSSPQTSRIDYQDIWTRQWSTPIRTVLPDVPPIPPPLRNFMINTTFEIRDLENGQRYLEWPSDRKAEVLHKIKLLNNYPKYFEPTICESNEFLLRGDCAPYLGEKQYIDPDPEHIYPNPNNNDGDTVMSEDEDVILLELEIEGKIDVLEELEDESGETDINTDDNVEEEENGEVEDNINSDGIDITDTSIEDTTEGDSEQSEAITTEEDTGKNTDLEDSDISTETDDIANENTTEETVIDSVTEEDIQETNSLEESTDSSINEEYDTNTSEDNSDNEVSTDETEQTTDDEVDTSTTEESAASVPVEENVEINTDEEILTVPEEPISFFNYLFPRALAADEHPDNIYLLRSNSAKYGDCYQMPGDMVSNQILTAEEQALIMQAQICEHEDNCPDMTNIPTISRRPDGETGNWNYSLSVENYFPEDYIDESMWSLTHYDYDDNAFSKGYPYHMDNRLPSLDNVRSGILRPHNIIAQPMYKGVGYQLIYDRFYQSKYYDVEGQKITGWRSENLQNKDDTLLGGQEDANTISVDKTDQMTNNWVDVNQMTDVSPHDQQAMKNIYSCLFNRWRAKVDPDSSKIVYPQNVYRNNVVPIIPGLDKNDARLTNYACGGEYYTPENIHEVDNVVRTDAKDWLYFGSSLRGGSKEVINIVSTLSPIAGVVFEGFAKINDGARFVYWNPANGPNSFIVLDNVVNVVEALQSRVSVLKEVIPVEVPTFNADVYHLITVTDWRENKRVFDESPFLKHYGFGDAVTSVQVGVAKNLEANGSLLNPGDETTVKVEFFNTSGYDWNLIKSADGQMAIEADELPSEAINANDYLHKTKHAIRKPTKFNFLEFDIPSEIRDYITITPSTHNIKVAGILFDFENINTTRIRDGFKGSYFVDLQVSNDLPESLRGKTYDIAVNLVPKYFDQFPGHSNDPITHDYILSVPEIRIGIPYGDDQGSLSGKAYRTSGYSSDVSFTDEFPKGVDPVGLKRVTWSELQDFRAIASDPNLRQQNLSTLYEQIGTSFQFVSTETETEAQQISVSFTANGINQFPIPRADQPDQVTVYLLAKSHSDHFSYGVQKVNENLKVSYYDFNYISRSSNMSRPAYREVRAAGADLKATYEAELIGQNSGEKLAVQELSKTADNFIRVKVRLENEGSAIAYYPQAKFFLSENVELLQQDGTDNQDNVVPISLQQDIAPGDINIVTILVKHKHSNAQSSFIDQIIPKSYAADNEAVIIDYVEAEFDLTENPGENRVVQETAGSFSLPYANDNSNQAQISISHSEISPYSYNVQLTSQNLSNPHYKLFIKSDNSVDFKELSADYSLTGSYTIDVQINTVTVFGALYAQETIINDYGAEELVFQKVNESSALTLPDGNLASIAIIGGGIGGGGGGGAKYVPIQVDKAETIEDVDDDCNFTDISSTSLRTMAKRLCEAGIIKGYDNEGQKIIKPYDKIARAALLKIVVKAKYNDNEIDQCIVENVPGESEYVFFTDVSKKEWYAKYICMGKVNGIISGYADGTFLPAQPIINSETLKIIYEAAGNIDLQRFNDMISDTSVAPWFEMYVVSAELDGIIQNPTMDSSIANSFNLIKYTDRILAFKLLFKVFQY